MLVDKYLEKYFSLPKQLKASVWYFICSFMQKAIAALTTPIFTRLMSSSDYGEYNVFLSWQSILSVFVTLNLFLGVYSSGLVKFSDRREEFISSFQGLTTLLVIIWSVFYYFFSSEINHLLSLDSVEMISMICLFWTSASYSFWAAEQRVQYKYKGLALITIISIIAKPLLGIILIHYMDNSVYARIISLVIVEITCFAWMFVYQIKRYPHPFSKFFWPYALRFNIPLIPHYLAQTVLYNADRIMIDKYISSRTAGIYSLAYSISLIMSIFNTALIETMGPWVYERIKLRQEKDINKVFILSTILVAFVNLLLIALAPEVVKIFAPKEYYEAIWVIPPIAMSVFFMHLYNCFSFFEFYYEKTAYIAFATVIAAILNIGLNYVFINRFGFVAAGYTTLICYLLYAICHYLVMNSITKKELGNNKVLSTRIIVVITLLFMIIGFVCCYLYLFSYVRYIIIFIGFSLLLLKREYFIRLAKQLINSRKQRINE